MADEKKSDGKTDEVKGKIKETVGDVTGDEELEVQGKGDQTKGNLKQAGEKLKDAVTDDD
ncbi:CsbD family protein [Pseudonocardia nantongensis]|uniref:CsbD family protein n=1 Tax=Pseudonocardia nantongensis TaxID=1181885 RepID=UPI00397D8642